MEKEETSEYKVIENFYLKLLEKKVNKNLKNGYEVLGGISICQYDGIFPNHKILYAQAMIKRIKNGNE